MRKGKERKGKGRCVLVIVGSRRLHSTTVESTRWRQKDSKVEGSFTSTLLSSRSWSEEKAVPGNYHAKCIGKWENSRNLRQLLAQKNCNIFTQDNIVDLENWCLSTIFFSVSIVLLLAPCAGKESKKIHDSIKENVLHIVWSKSFTNDFKAIITSGAWRSIVKYSPQKLY